MLYEHHRNHDSSLPIGVNTFRKEASEDDEPQTIELARATEAEKGPSSVGCASSRTRTATRPMRSPAPRRRPLATTTCSRCLWTPPASARCSRSPRRSSRSAVSTAATCELQAEVDVV